MQFAALFIEYFVSGATALLWLAPAFGVAPRNAASMQQQIALLLLPMVYVVGHVVDAVSRLLVRPFQSRMPLKDYAEDREWSAGTDTTALIMYSSPELAKHLLALSSRDRIARGAVLNALLLSVVIVVRPGMYSIPAGAR